MKRTAADFGLALRIGRLEQKLFDDRLIALALNRLEPTPARFVLD